MDDLMKKQYEDLFESYKKSQMVSYGSPDQYQYRQNKLLQKLSEVILFPYLIEKEKKEAEKDG